MKSPNLPENWKTSEDPFWVSYRQQQLVIKLFYACCALLVVASGLGALR